MSDNSNKPKPNFAEGMKFYDPREGAPEYIIGNITVYKGDLIDWLEEQEEDKIHLDVRRSKAGNPFVVKAKPKQQG
jgi:hypothetical protein